MKVHACLLFCAVLHAELAAWLTAYLQNWVDPVDAMDRLVARPEFKGKIYLQYERQESEQRPTKRVFGRANSGLVFQEAQALDLNSVPMLHLFYADKSFSGAHGTKYPVYGT